jgi:hypothetical protein
MVAWPEVLSAQRYARTAAKSPTSHFETLDADAAGEIEAIAAQIIPSIGGPGGRESLRVAPLEAISAASHAGQVVGHPV